MKELNETIIEKIKSLKIHLCKPYALLLNTKDFKEIQKLDNCKSMYGVPVNIYGIPLFWDLSIRKSKILFLRMEIDTVLANGIENLK